MSRRGVSIIEVVGVIALLGVLGLAALVWSPSPDPMRLRAAAQEVQSSIEYARQLAMATNVTHGAAFVANGAYTVYRSAVGTPVESPLTHQNMVETLSTRYPGVTIQNNYSVEFDSFGAPTVGGGGAVTLANGPATLQVQVLAGTGKVVIP
jgi:Tfp pilus assembly protein FimT